MWKLVAPGECMPTFEDEVMRYSDDRAYATTTRLLGRGSGAVVVKQRVIIPVVVMPIFDSEEIL